MSETKIGLSISNNYSMPISEVLTLLKKIGFAAVSPEWISPERTAEVITTARKTGLEIQSVHAPFKDVHKLWSHDKNISQQFTDTLISLITDCAKHNVPIIVMHAWIGFDYSFNPDTVCFDNFDRIIETAALNNVKIAFENTECEEYLNALLERYRDNDIVGFCWDAGHEMCYNNSKDLLKMYGNRLIMTHLNDNLGISNPNGTITWLDDLHLLPYDGIANWEYNVKRLKKSQRLNILNFELNLNSKPGRHENDVYAKMPLEEYFTKVYERAYRIIEDYDTF